MRFADHQVKYASTSQRNASRAYLHAMQDGRCRICESEEKLVVDHDHETGNIRGLLCHRCNIGLGWFRDHPSLLNRAITYLGNARDTRRTAKRSTDMVDVRCICNRLLCQASPDARVYIKCPRCDRFTHFNAEHQRSADAPGG